MIFIDASVYFAFYNERDLHHNRAVQIFQRLESAECGACFSTDYTFNEVVGVTLRKFGKQRALTIGNKLRESIIEINIDDHMLSEAWKVFTKTKLSLNLVDCTHLVAMKLARTNLIATFDKQFEKVKGVRVIC